MDARGRFRRETVRPFDRWPVFTGRDRSSEEEFDDSHSGERKGKDGGS
jgi:hypothetical protein